MAMTQSPTPLCIFTESRECIVHTLDYGKCRARCIKRKVAALKIPVVGYFGGIMALLKHRSPCLLFALILLVSFAILKHEIVSLMCCFKSFLLRTFSNSAELPNPRRDTPDFSRRNRECQLQLPKFSGCGYCCKIFYRAH